MRNNISFTIIEIIKFQKSSNEHINLYCKFILKLHFISKVNYKANQCHDYDFASIDEAVAYLFDKYENFVYTYHIKTQKEKKCFAINAERRTETIESFVRIAEHL